MIVFFGPVGAGKSVQGKMLGERFGWDWISTGNIFRASTDPDIQATLAAGQLISSEQTYQVLGEALENVRHQQIILDGFPRRKEQAEWLIANQAAFDFTVDLIIVIDVAKDEILKRLTARGRVDDDAAVIEGRLKIYHDEVDPILQYLSENNVPVVHVDGVGDVDTIHGEIMEQIVAHNLDV
ncbi:MAG: adk, adenylate kinase [Candidatus Saccharibacteria bacterium]|nr:adk, adenylate kinase [Candidatus Saccharibacteria bacterium]